MNRAIIPPQAGTALAAVLVALLAACSTGDGKTLKNTVVPTTVPPPDTTPLDSVAIDATTDPAAIDLISTDGVSEAAGADGGAVRSTPPIVPTVPADGPMQLVGPWQDDMPIDALYTCDGEDISPALSWRGVPDGAVELALVVTDDDEGTPDNPFVQWIVAGFAPELISLLEGQVPVGAIEATNSLGDVGWIGPCPSAGGGPHSYRFKLHALAQQIELGNGVPVDEVIPYLEDLTIAAAELTGTYER